MIGFNEIIGACVAVIVAGSPAMVALLKINELHVAINSQLSSMIAATKAQSEERIAATMKQSEERIAATMRQADERIAATKLQSDLHSEELKKSLENIKIRNDQLLDQLAEAVKRLPRDETSVELRKC